MRPMVHQHQMQVLVMVWLPPLLVGTGSCPCSKLVGRVITGTGLWGWGCLACCCSAWLFYDSVAVQQPHQTVITRIQAALWSAVPQLQAGHQGCCLLGKLSGHDDGCACCGHYHWQPIGCVLEDCVAEICVCNHTDPACGHQPALIPQLLSMQPATSACLCLTSYAALTLLAVDREAPAAHRTLLVLYFWSSSLAVCCEACAIQFW